MTRAEIIANQSVQDEIVSLMEEHIPGVLYTVIPGVTGRGKASYKMGSSPWPEMNFILVSYIEDSQVSALKAVIAAVKKKFSGEGIKLFLIKAQDL